MLDVVQAAKGFFVPCRLCDAGVGLIESADGKEISPLTDKNCFVAQHEEENAKETVVICGRCVHSFRWKTIVSVGTLHCFRCYRDCLTVIYTSDGAVHLLGGRATYEAAGKLTLFGNTICNNCLVKLGWWGRLKRRLAINFENWFRGGGSVNW